jgi:DNA polymerase III alpha subunit
MDTPFYCEFSTRSNFSFLEGAAHPEELVVTAARLGHGAIGLADRNTVSGTVRAHMVAKEAGLKYHPGARLVFSDGTPDILAYPQDRPGWGRLCRLLTTGNLRGEKGAADLRLEDLIEWGEGLSLALVAGTGSQTGEPEPSSIPLAAGRALRDRFGKNVRLAVAPSFGVSNAHAIALAASDAISLRHQPDGHQRGALPCAGTPPAG